MDKRDRERISGKLMDVLAPLAYKLMGEHGVPLCMEALIWLASSLAAETNMPMEDFLMLAGKCYQFNRDERHAAPKEQVH